jgi:hypothetical protein
MTAGSVANFGFKSGRGLNAEKTVRIHNLDTCTELPCD